MFVLDAEIDYKRLTKSIATTTANNSFTSKEMDYNYQNQNKVTSLVSEVLEEKIVKPFKMK